MLQSRFAVLALARAGISYDVADVESRRKAAEAALLWAERNPEGWFLPSIVHWANILLGQIAFDRGDVRLAARHLLDSGDCGSTPQLRTYGPDFELATDLLTVGERDVVVQCLEKCESIWVLGRAAVADWIVRIRAGEFVSLAEARILDGAEGEVDSGEGE